MMHKLFRTTLAIAAAALLTSCESGVDPCDQGIVMPTTPTYFILHQKLKAGETCVWPLLFGTSDSAVSQGVEKLVADTAITAGDPANPNVTATMDGLPEDEPLWFAPHIFERGEHTLRVTATR